jgi:hypothetical protein
MGQFMHYHVIQYFGGAMINRQLKLNVPGWNMIPIGSAGCGWPYRMASPHLFGSYSYLVEKGGFRLVDQPLMQLFRG